jgi:chromosome segregation ATPase
MARKPKAAPRELAAEQDNQIRVLRELLAQTRTETGELERVNAELKATLGELQAFRDRHRDREAEIDSLIQRTKTIANERAHLVIAGNDLLRNVRYMWGQCHRIVNGPVQ